MADLPKDRLLTLRQRVEEQRNTIDDLKREGHDCPDAERQLRRLERELRATESPASRPDVGAPGGLLDLRSIC